MLSARRQRARIAQILERILSPVTYLQALQNIKVIQFNPNTLLTVQLYRFRGDLVDALAVILEDEKITLGAESHVNRTDQSTAGVACVWHAGDAFNGLGFKCEKGDNRKRWLF